MKLNKLIYIFALLPTVAAAQVSTPVIKEAPEGGRKVYYNRMSDYFYASGGNVFKATDESPIPAEMIFYDNGDVYIKDPIAHLKYDSYVKARQEDNKIILNMPQPVRLYNGTTYSIARMYTGTWNNQNWYYRDEDSQTIVFEIQPDGSIVMEKSEVDENGTPISIMGMLLGDGWSGYGEYNAVYTPLEKQMAYPPASVIPDETWVLESANQTARFVKVAIDGDDFYLGNFYAEMTDCYIKGKIADGKVTFENGQFLDYEQEVRLFLYVFGGQVVKEWDADLELTVTRMKFDDKLEFDYDANAKRLTSSQCLVINAADNKVSFRMYYENASVRYQDPDVKYVEPQNPVLGDVASYNGESGYVTFDMPVLDRNGNLLKVENLYFNFYINENPFVFWQDEYPSIPENGMLNIPFLYHDGKDIYGGEARHYVYYYAFGADTVGVRSIYIDESGEELASDIVTFSFNGPVPGSVDDLHAGETPVSSVYYDLTGAEVANPEGGIFIRIDTFADGTRRSVKEAIK